MRYAWGSGEVSAHGHLPACFLIKTAWWQFVSISESMRASLKSLILCNERCFPILAEPLRERTIFECQDYHCHKSTCDDAYTHNPQNECYTIDLFDTPSLSHSIAAAQKINKQWTKHFSCRPNVCVCKNPPIDVLQTHVLFNIEQQHQAIETNRKKCHARYGTRWTRSPRTFLLDWFFFLL